MRFCLGSTGSLRCAGCRDSTRTRLSEWFWYQQCSLIFSFSLSTHFISCSTIINKLILSFIYLFFSFTRFSFVPSCFTLFLSVPGSVAHLLPSCFVFLINPLHSWLFSSLLFPLSILCASSLPLETHHPTVCCSNPSSHFLGQCFHFFLFTLSSCPK